MPGERAFDNRAALRGERAADHALPSEKTPIRRSFLSLFAILNSLFISN
jgi:hypothetical protein